MPCRGWLLQLDWNASAREHAQEGVRAAHVAAAHMWRGGTTASKGDLHPEMVLSTEGLRIGGRHIRVVVVKCKLC